MTVEIASTATGTTAWVPPSWDEVVRTHADRVYRLAYRLAGNRADAEDLTQETFVRVFRSLAEYTPGTFEGWLHRITTNLFLDMVRRRQRIRFDALPDDAGDKLASREVGPEQAYHQRNLDPEIQRALDALPADFRAAVVLCDLEQLSYEEIAATLDIKVGTVRSRIHRGRVLLREALGHLNPSAQIVPGDHPAEQGGSPGSSDKLAPLASRANGGPPGGEGVAGGGSSAEASSPGAHGASPRPSDATGTNASFERSSASRGGR